MSRQGHDMIRVRLMATPALAPGMQAPLQTPPWLLVLLPHPPPLPTRPTGSAVVSLSAFLLLVSSHDFDNEPLLFSFDRPLSHADKDTARAAFAAARGTAKADEGGGEPMGPGTEDASGSLTCASATVWIGTDQELHGAACCADGPSYQTLQRLRALASCSLVRLNAAIQLSPETADRAAAAHDSTTPTTASAQALSFNRATITRMSAVFDAPIHEFDAVLELNAALVPTAHLTWRACAMSPQAHAFANMQHGEIGLGLGVDPVRALMRTLRECYGELAIFAYDGLGGCAIALKWRPAAFLPTPVRVAATTHRLMMPRVASSATSVEASWTVPNVADVLVEMAEMGGLLVRKASFARSGLLTMLDTTCT